MKAYKNISIKKSTKFFLKIIFTNYDDSKNFKKTNRKSARFLFLRLLLHNFIDK